MANVGKKKQKRILTTSVMNRVLRDQLGRDADFLNYAPDSWSSIEKELFDLAAEIEYEMLKDIRDIIEE